MIDLGLPVCVSSPLCSISQFTHSNRAIERGSDIGLVLLRKTASASTPASQAVSAIRERLTESRPRSAQKAAGDEDGQTIRIVLYMNCDHTNRPSSIGLHL